ncbi:MAG: PAS domain-containing protein [Alphaproteobacteria bacterium]|nr:PAS domain-containing protein [Alphaproteobacteria bacterium]
MITQYLPKIRITRTTGFGHGFICCGEVRRWGISFISIHEPIGFGDAMRPLLECWDKARNGRTMPARSDFDRLSLPRDLLANMFLLEVQHQPRRSQFRLMGTTVAEMLGEDWTGKYLDELPKANRQVINQYEETVEKQAPTEFHNQYIKIDPPCDANA